MKNWQKLVITFLVAIVALLAEFVFGASFLAQLVVTIAGSILAISMFVGMIQTIRSGSYGVDLLAITAIAATLIVGEYWAALIIIVMLVGGESLEDYAAGVARRELTSLLDKSPDNAHLIKDGKTSDVGLSDVPVGSRLLIKPLEVIPIDGKLISEHATLDEASVTGETKPYELNKGDAVLSGSINSNMAIEIETTEEAANSQLQKIVSLVREAESQPANFVRLADRYAIPFTIAAYLIAGIAFAITKNPVRIAQVLVVASPCPLILAAPIAFVSGMSRSSKNGVLIKNGTIIEKLATAKSIFFDKTGTITTGKLAVDEVLPEEGMSEVELESLVYALEKSSGHILARSFVAYAQKKHETVDLDIINIKEVPGLGVTGELGDSLIKIGRASFTNGPENLAGTAFYVAKDDKYIGRITFSDQLRDDAKQVMAELAELNVKNVAMITGDNQATAEKIAAEVGIHQVYAQLLPEQKLELVRAATDKPTIMVGDGVNDAPALALAEVGIAMGLGESTVASETADMILLKNDLAAVPKAIKISRDTMSIAKQAVLIGIFICLILMLIAATGLIPATVGALFQELVDTVSIFYALRALRGFKH
ncbi:MAG: cadmium-translocating P-type ATPase [Streptococcaceae bacterium]|jgi:heavy metal translocating P-type ATPase|nr:cadmium-translocating P-type ATPase [Streptococcaceae bacterium]